MVIATVMSLRTDVFIDIDNGMEMVITAKTIPKTEVGGSKIWRRAVCPGTPTRPVKISGGMKRIGPYRKDNDASRPPCGAPKPPCGAPQSRLVERRKRRA